MTLAGIVEQMRAARDAGAPMGVILGDQIPFEARLSWSHVCVAELMRLGWLGQAVDLHTKTPLVTACALTELLPPIYREPNSIGGTAIYTLTPNQLPQLESQGTWIVAGMNGSRPTLPPSSYWVRHFDQPVPANSNAIEGFDTDSFFASLLQSLGEFPPQAVVNAPSKPYCAGGGSQTPANQLQGMLYRHSQQASQKGQSLFREITEAYTKSSPASDPFVWADRIEHACEMSSRLQGPGSGSSMSPFMVGLATSQSPRVADKLLQRAERLSRTNPDAEKQGSMWPSQLAGILCKRAKLLSGAAAEKMYAEANRLMALSGSGTKAGLPYQLKQWAETLAEWADRKAQEAQGIVLFETALEKLEQAMGIVPERMFASKTKDVSIQTLYIRLVELRARKLGAATPARYFEAAREHCKAIFESPDTWRGYLALGLLDVYQTLSVSPENFERAIALAPQHKVPIISDWGTALMESGQLTAAYQKFTEAVALDEQAFIPRVNMSGIRLQQSRAGEPMLDEAVHHAEIAESLKPGIGAYNLACAAGQRGDRDAVEGWMNFSAEKGYLQNRDRIMADADFQSIVSERWFSDLLDELLP